MKAHYVIKPLFAKIEFVFINARKMILPLPSCGKVSI
jgi:hypothetical protein